MLVPDFTHALRQQVVKDVTGLMDRANKVRDMIIATPRWYLRPRYLLQWLRLTHALWVGNRFLKRTVGKPW